MTLNNQVSAIEISLLDVLASGAKLPRIGRGIIVKVHKDRVYLLRNSFIGSQRITNHPKRCMYVRSS